MQQVSAPITTSFSSRSGVSLSEFRASHAAISSMRLSGQVGQLTVDISYESGRFSISSRAHSGPNTLPRGLTHDEVLALQHALQGESIQSVPGEEITALDAFSRYLSLADETQPSGRFDNTVFGDIQLDDRGTIKGSMRIGIDVVAILLDAHGDVTVATQVIVMRKPGAFEPLSRSDQMSLAVALEKFIATSQPNPNPLWVQVLNDLS